MNRRSKLKSRPAAKPIWRPSWKFQSLNHRSKLKSRPGGCSRIWRQLTWLISVAEHRKRMLNPFAALAMKLKTGNLVSFVDNPVAEPATEAEVALSSNADLASVVDILVAESAIEAEVTPSSKAELRPVGEAGDPLLYNLAPPIYSSPFNRLSMFPVEMDSEAGATVFALPQSFVKRHPIAAVGLTIALAFLVSIGIFTYVSTSRAGELFFDWGEKVLGRFYSQPITSDPPPPASSAPSLKQQPSRE